MKQAFAIEFDAPPGWREFADDSRLVFQSSDGEELIVSGAVIGGDGLAGTRDQIRANVLRNAIASISHAVSVPELRVTRALEKTQVSSNLSCWRIDAQTVDGEVLFLQAVIETDRGALLVTFEAPLVEGAQTKFERFLATIRRSSRPN